MILELNARPGLAIQIANRCGLHGRLTRVSAAADGAPLEDRLAFSRRHFGLAG